MLIDVLSEKFDWRGGYRPFTGCVTPRPIALVSTVNAQGQANLAPFSFFNLCSANPPVLMFSPALDRNREHKHTYRNTDATREFVVAIVDEAIGPQMVRSAANLPYGESEFEFAGLTGGAAKHVKPQLVREAPVNFECRVRQIVSMGDRAGSGQVIFGDILAVHIRDSLLTADGGSIDPSKLHTVGRLGGEYYATVRNPWLAKIPDVIG